MPESHLRAADTDREAVATALGTHMAAGRLTLAKYDERVARAYAAKTYGELEQLTADLPAAARRTPAAPTAPPAPHQQSQPARAQGCSPSHARHDLAQGWRAWAGTAVIVLTIWLLTGLSGTFSYLWPMWVIGPWGAVLLMRTLAERGAADRRRRLET